MINCCVFNKPDLSYNTKYMSSTSLILFICLLFFKQPRSDVAFFKYIYLNNIIMPCLKLSFKLHCKCVCLCFFCFLFFFVLFCFCFCFFSHLWYSFIMVLKTKKKNNNNKLALKYLSDLCDCKHIFDKIFVVKSSKTGRNLAQTDPWKSI